MNAIDSGPHGLLRYLEVRRQTARTSFDRVAPDDVRKKTLPAQIARWDAWIEWVESQFPAFADNVEQRVAEGGLTAADFREMQCGERFPDHEPESAETKENQ
jgi:hypothetical protein